MSNEAIKGISRRAFVASAVSGLALVAGCAANEPDQAANQQPAEGEPSAGSTEQQADNGASQNPSLPDDDPVSAIVASLTLEQKVAQLFIGRTEAFVNYDASTSDDNLSGLTALGDDALGVFSGLPLGGVCMFTENLVDPDQTRALLAGYAQCSNDALGLPLFIAVDEEGGSVARIANDGAFGIENVGSARDLSGSGDEQTVFEAYQWIGTYLADLGFNVDFAPVCDIANNPEAMTMYDRTFGDSADMVEPMVRAAVRGLAQTPVACCAKHFPGIGGAQGDSHISGIATYKTFDEMAAEEFVPFAAAIEEGADFVMVGHVDCPTASDSGVPASFDPNVIEGALRGRLGFSGVVLSDSLEMGAVMDLYGWAGIGVAALLAGNDMILLPPNVRVAYQGVLDAIADGRIEQSRIDESVRRVVRLKLKMAGRI